MSWIDSSCTAVPFVCMTLYISACSEEFCVLPAMAVECQLENSNRSSSGESVADRGEVL